MAHPMKSEINKTDAIYSPNEKCIPQEMVIRNVRLAAAYVPFQKLCTIFSPIESLKRGTVFPELFSPYPVKDKSNM
ncbi:spore coat associated protein CotJA [Clostridium brassicae]|uniref:Spore coat associated protein CotJA n=1 Tax=Clostridium brassicae TaxID=2999072 RepID=A0ABT4D726_9CLOT|nr:spore coat associated protein CotJA [Clostridium brassicae]MCY6958091.1 spore coat associated protein CotJA [Clostridium brassicae]